MKNFHLQHNKCCLEVIVHTEFICFRPVNYYIYDIIMQYTTGKTDVPFRAPTLFHYKVCLDANIFSACFFNEDVRFFYTVQVLLKLSL